MQSTLMFDASRDQVAPWELVTDGVMGGESDGRLDLETVAGRRALHLKGSVRLDNDGGFLQMARNIDGAAGWTGIEVALRGNGETYNIHLRTTRLERPWQSFRAQVFADPQWRTARLPFDAFEAHRTDVAFDPAELRRIGFVAIGRAFHAELAVSRVALYAD